MPETAAWKIPYPDYATNPDIPRDMRLLAERIDVLPLDEPGLDQVGRAHIQIGDTGSNWKPLREVWSYDESTRQWHLVWYGPREPKFAGIRFVPVAPNLGDAVQVVGSVIDQMNHPVTEGTLVLMRQNVSRSGWSEVGRGAPTSKGSFTLTDPGITIVGTVYYRIDYIAPSNRYESASSQEYSFTVGVPQVTGMRYTSMTSTSAQFTWNAINGVTGYEIFKDGVLLTTVTTNDSGALTITAGEVPHWKVRAFKNDSAGNPVYGPFSDELHVIDTVTAWTSQLANVNYGDGVTFSGTVRTIANSPVNTGAVEIWVKSNGRTWQYTGLRLSVSAGAWSATTTWSHVGSGTQAQARYIPAPNTPEQPSQADSNIVTIGIGTVGTLGTGAASHTSCTITWPAVAGATRYEIGNNTTVIPGGTLGAVTSKEISLSQNTQYNWRVRACRQDFAGNWVCGGWSPILYFNGGLPEVRDAGSAWVRKECAWSGAHRNDSVGWDTSPNVGGAGYVRQGYYSTPYGGGGYVGIYDYGDWGVAHKIIADLGGEGSWGRWRYDNGWASAGFTKVYKRGDVGNTSCCNVYFYSGTSWVGGGRPGLVRHGATAHLCYNSWHQINFSADMAMDIAKQRSGARNIAIYAGSKTEYTALNPHTAGAEDGDIWVLWNWNYVTQAYVAPRWWR